MRAILTKPSPAPLLGRPTIHLVMESMARWGISHITCVGEIERSLGKRFGIETAYSRRPLSEITSEWGEEPVLIATGDVLPLRVPGIGDWFFFLDGEWTGWAVQPASELSALPSETLIEELPEEIGGDQRVVFPEKLLSVRGFSHLHASNMEALRDPVYHHLFGSSISKRAEGIFVSHEVKIHRTAQLEGPLLIGEESEILAGTKVGPNVVVGNRCILDKGSVLEDTVVLDETFVGEGITGSGCVMGEGLIIDLMAGTCTEVDDPLVLGDVKKPAFFDRVRPKRRQV